MGTVINFITSVLRKDFAFEYRISSYCVAAVALLSSVLLLVATYNETITSTTKRGLLLPWLIFHMIGIIALIVASIAFITMGSVVLSSPYVMKNKDEDEEMKRNMLYFGSILYVGVGVGCLIFGKHSYHIVFESPLKILLGFILRCNHNLWVTFDFL